jgi:oxygen-independent coproporphyrinogen III oxidase
MAGAHGPKVNSMETSVKFDADLVRRYDRPGPRYTSYPTAVQFHDGFREAEYRNAAASTNGATPPAPLSLYVHVPFCASPCFYCGCTKIITRNREQAESYLTRLYREIELQAALFDRERVVDQLHFGGGTPTFLNPWQLEDLLKKLGWHFQLRSDDQREFSIEIDPRTCDLDTVDLLARAGMNRMSLGIQDFDPEVQQAVNRIQSPEQTFAIMERARRAGFKSVSVDLIYGLPKQNRERFAHTLDRVLAERPDRFAVYSYAHLPHMFKPQKRIKSEDIPSGAEKLALLGLTMDKLTGAGYVYIGMDHFALPDDELAVALREGTLHRNFQGYSTHADCDLVALGVSSIGKLGDTYAQNYKTLHDYYQAIDSGHLAVHRGLVLNDDDRLRRAVIQDIMCRARIDYAHIEQAWPVRFEEYFAREIAALAGPVEDGLVVMRERGFELTPVGRLLMRNVAMCFDAYLPGHQQSETPRFSRAV